MFVFLFFAFVLHGFVIISHGFRMAFTLYSHVGHNVFHIVSYRFDMAATQTWLNSFLLGPPQEPVVAKLPISNVQAV